MKSNEKPFVLGLTGPTGAGKSTVGAILCEYGFKTVDADRAARSITEKGSETLSRLARAFGEDVISPEGELQRQLLAERAFCSRENTEKLNSITHPAILASVKGEIDKLFQSGCKKIILDAPQLFEANAQGLCDFVLSVLAAKETRVMRIMQRDGISRDSALMRISAQRSDDFFIENSDFVIYNDADFCKVNTQIEALLERLSGLKGAEG